MSSAGWGGASRSFRRPVTAWKYVSRWAVTPRSSAPKLSAACSVACGSGSIALISRLRSLPGNGHGSCRAVWLVAEAGKPLALGAALGFALLLAVALALAPFLVLVVTGDDADALAQRAVLGVRGELRAAGPVVAARAAAGALAAAAGTAGGALAA